ncbi:MAG: hypothetical protein MRZ79_24680 [Bacteroidia bacterium]|nr:hypothetical protein [Bacteroidia bacterium]
MSINHNELTRARISRAAIERLYIEMRHLFNSGVYSELGQRGEVLTEALLTLAPEIYGSMADPNKVELEGLIYVIDRQPKGIEECRFVKLVSEEGYRESDFEVIVPASRRRACYRIDSDHMFIEVTRGRSEIYDILTHLTFLYMEADKIMNHALLETGESTLEWKYLEAVVNGKVTLNHTNKEIAFTHLSTILGRSFAETKNAYERMAARSEKNNGLFSVVYGLGKTAMDEFLHGRKRAITFSPTLRDRIGHHIYGEIWAKAIKRTLIDRGLIERPLHIISANLHSVMNSLYAYHVLKKKFPKNRSIEFLANQLSRPDSAPLRQQVREFALQNGMYEIEDDSGTNIYTQVFDTSQLDPAILSPELNIDLDYIKNEKPVIFVMDYAFGEQAYETMDELLKSYNYSGKTYYMPVKSISVMGKAGILIGGKGDIMIPSAHVFEGTADNYPLKNDFECEDFHEMEDRVCEGAMITVLGTSLQNTDVLSYFKNSSWKAIGLEMEGAHYQKAIQAASFIRKTISKDVTLRYAYYASDNPLVTGSTLASGPLGSAGVKPTYLITRKILDKIFSGSKALVKQEK